MSFETALRLTEILLAWALVQSSVEHLVRASEQWLFVPRLVLALLLALGVAPGLASAGLLAHALLVLRRFDGPYNGGSDRMVLLCLICVTAAHWAPVSAWQELALGYLAGQLVLSYTMSGWVKLRNPDWRSGRALADVFLFSAYPVSEGLRVYADRQGLLWIGSWGVILFEVFFAVGMVHPMALGAVLTVAAGFHLANACVFGLNRFFWAWLTAYPSIFWLQDRLIG